MANWLMTIDLRHVWRDEALTFEQRRDAIVKIFRAHKWHDWSDVAEIVNMIESAGDKESFNYAWNVMYDQADCDRVWIKIF